MKMSEQLMDAAQRFLALGQSETNEFVVSTLGALAEKTSIQAEESRSDERQEATRDILRVALLGALEYAPNEVEVRRIRNALQAMLQ